MKSECTPSLGKYAESVECPKHETVDANNTIKNSSDFLNECPGRRGNRTEYRGELLVLRKHLTILVEDDAVKGVKFIRVHGVLHVRLNKRYTDLIIE